MEFICKQSHVGNYDKLIAFDSFEWLFSVKAVLKNPNQT